jgi:hypothetical protein
LDLSAFFFKKKKKKKDMTTREHHYAKIRETLTDALAKIEVVEDDENVNSNSNNNGDEEEEEGQTHSSSSSWRRIPTPFVEMQDKFPEQMYPEVRIERTIGGGILGNKIANNNNNNNNNNNSEVILVESSANSFRLSVKLKHSDELDAILTKQLSRFMHQRAEQFSIVRKRAISDEFDLSFLVTAKHKKEFVNSSLVGFMVDFLKSVDGEISEQKLSVSSRGRAVAEEFLGGF